MPYNRSYNAFTFVTIFDNKNNGFSHVVFKRIWDGVEGKVPMSMYMCVEKMRHAFDCAAQ